MSGRRRANKGGLRTIAHAPRVELEASIIEVRDVSDGDLGNQRVQERVVRRERRPQDRLPFGNPLRFLLNEEYLWSQQPCICTRHQHLHKPHPLIMRRSGGGEGDGPECQTARR